MHRRAAVENNPRRKPRKRSQLSKIEFENHCIACSKAPRDYNAATCSEKERESREKIDAVRLVPSFRSGRKGYRGLEGDDSAWNCS